jgi:hypothetical protein
MNRARKAFILKLLKQHNIMSFATVRPDGFPQSTRSIQNQDRSFHAAAR